MQGTNHAYSRCDTTSRPYGRPKVTALQKMKNDQTLAKCADVFTKISSLKRRPRGRELAMRLLSGGSKN